MPLGLTKTPEMLLTKDEFVELWASMIESLYKTTISDDKVYNDLVENKEDSDHLALNVGTMLTVVAMRDWDSSKIEARYRDIVRQEVIKKVYQDLYGMSDASLDSSITYYNQQYEFVESIFPTARDEQKALDEKQAAQKAKEAADKKKNIKGDKKDKKEKKNDAKPQEKYTDQYSDDKIKDRTKTQMTGIACLIVEKGMGKDIKKYSGAVEQLGLILVNADVAFSRLMKNSIIDGNSVFFGKLKFIVSK